MDALGALLDRGQLAQAAEWLYRAHAPAVRTFVRYRVRPEVVDDVCQEVWAAVNQSMGRYRRDANPIVWVYGIARHKIADAFRRHKSHETLDTDIANGRFRADTVSTPRTKLSRRRKLAAIRDALTDLSDDDRELFLLRFVHGLKAGEIAELLGSVKANTISKRLERLLRRLQASVAGAATRGA